MLSTNFPTGDALPAPRARRTKRKRGKVGRSYSTLGTATTIVLDAARGTQTRVPGFFPTPVTWGDGPVAREIRAQGGERVASPGRAPRVEFPAPRSPSHGTVVEGCPTVTVGGGPSPADRALSVPSPCPDPVTRFLDDGDNAARDARRRTVVRAMVKAR